MSNGHTPGPLQAHIACPNWYGFEARFFEVTTEDSGIVAFIKDGICRDTAIANTRLFAAAPDLLEALEMIVAEADSYTARTGKPVYNWLDQARAAIAKAKGQPC